MIALREIAATFGLMLPKGPGAGELGSVRALLMHLVAAYSDDKALTIHQLVSLVARRVQEDAPQRAVRSVARATCMLMTGAKPCSPSRVRVICSYTCSCHVFFAARQRGLQPAYVATQRHVTNPH